MRVVAGRASDGFINGVRDVRDVGGSSGRDVLSKARRGMAPDPIVTRRTGRCACGNGMARTTPLGRLDMMRQAIMALGTIARDETD